eukprot:3977117-Prymnesium_polylepis.1
MDERGDAAAAGDGAGAGAGAAESLGRGSPRVGAGGGGGVRPRDGAGGRGGAPGGPGGAGGSGGAPAGIRRGGGGGGGAPAALLAAYRMSGLPSFLTDPGASETRPPAPSGWFVKRCTRASSSHPGCAAPPLGASGGRRNSAASRCALASSFLSSASHGGAADLARATFFAFLRSAAESCSPIAETSSSTISPKPSCTATSRALDDLAIATGAGAVKRGETGRRGEAGVGATLEEFGHQIEVAH